MPQSIWAIKNLTPRIRIYQPRRRRARFVSSLERGNDKSHDRLLVASHEPVNVGTYAFTMKTKQSESNFRRTLRKILRRRSRRHDALLVLNMSTFNFTDGWSRTFSNNEYGRAWT